LEQPDHDGVRVGRAHRLRCRGDLHGPSTIAGSLALPSSDANFSHRTLESPVPMPKTVILGSARTPIGKMGGGLATLDATELGSTAIEAALERSTVEPEQVQHVIMGQVLQAGQGQIPSRQAQIKAGIPKEV